MMSDDEYKVTVEGPGLTVNRTVSKELCDQVVVLLLTGSIGRTQATQRPAALTHAPTTRSQTGEEIHSVREFIDSVEAKRAPDKITAFAAFLRAHRGMEHFGRPDLVQCYEEAAERVPKNLSRDIQWALRSGWIAPKSGQKDTYFLTNSGTKAVEEKFSADVVRRTRGLFSGARPDKKGAAGNGEPEPE